jgi:uncharacterized protein (TIGR02246 family)
LVLLALTAAVGVVHAQSAEDNAAIRSLIIRYAEALANRDASPLRGDYAEQAGWRGAYGDERTGVDSILAIKARQFADPGYAKGVLTISGPEEVTFPRPDVALIERYHRFEGQRLADGNKVPIQDFVSTLIVSKEKGRWLIQRESVLLLRLPEPAKSAAYAPFPGVDEELEVDERAHVSCAPPVYPASLRGSGAAGTVILRYVVGLDGRAEPGNIRVVRSTNKAFEQAAIDRTLACTGTPARLKGKAVRQVVLAEVEFTRP